LHELLLTLAAADILVDSSSGVNAKLLKRRQDIEELNRVQGLLVKLQVRRPAHPMIALPPVSLQHHEHWFV
jgi:hypothetical protein